MIKKLAPLIFLGLVIRLILASITYHSDIQHFDFAGSAILKGNFLNFYDYPNYPFNYPPLVYFSLGAIDGLLTGWEDSIFHDNFLFNYPQVLGDTRLNIHLILLKLPYLIIDWGIILLLLKIFPNEREKKWAVIFWIFNPINLYATYMIGQFDIIPVFFVLLAMYFFAKKNTLLSAIALGIGGGFKIFPLLLLIPLAAAGKGVEKLKMILVGVGTYLIILLPFLPSKGFRSSALIAGQSLKSLYAQIPISGGESLLIFPALLIFLYLITWRLNSQKIWQNFLIILLVFFIFTHYHPQWFLWITPFLIFDLIYNGSKNLVPQTLILLSYTGILFWFDTGLTIGLFSPLTSQYVIVSNLGAALQKNIDVFLLRSIFQTIFAGSALYLIYIFFP